uniref:Uncharacterized protein n=1 Tax=Rhizophora mucronata TaxID=61149 RepID=A0A2P2QKL3_RHIMU
MDIYHLKVSITGVYHSSRLHVISCFHLLGGLDAIDSSASCCMMSCASTFFLLLSLTLKPCLCVYF